MREELQNLKAQLMVTANNSKNSKKNKELAKEALDAVRKTIRQLDDPSLRKETTSVLFEVFGSKQKLTNIKK